MRLGGDQLTTGSSGESFGVGEPRLYNNDTLGPPVCFSLTTDVLCCARDELRASFADLSSTRRPGKDRSIAPLLAPKLSHPLVGGFARSRPLYVPSASTST